jgi:hypothetical protein
LPVTYSKAVEENWRGMGYYYFDRDSLKAAVPFPAPPVTNEPAHTACELVLQKAGDTLPARDPVHRRVVREVQEGTGHIIRWVRESGSAISHATFANGAVGSSARPGIAQKV